MGLLLLLAAAFSAGVINSVAGGGSFLTFPALVFAGVPSVSANASSTVALVPSAFTSSLAYRQNLQSVSESRLKHWLLVCLLGGVLGSGLLLLTSDRAFKLIAPWLLLFATVLFAFGGPISNALRGRLQGNHFALLLMLFPVAVYGGYFGGGIGIMILAAFRLYGMTDIHAMNGIKTLLSATLNAIASAIFIAAHQVRWQPTLLMMIGAIAGGWLGPIFARRIRPALIRQIVIAVGVLMTAWFFEKAYGT